MIRLTDEQWERIRDHFPEESIADGRPGRKPTPTRCALEAVLWILNTGAQSPCEHDGEDDVQTNSMTQTASHVGPSFGWLIEARFSAPARRLRRDGDWPRRTYRSGRRVMTT